MRSSWNKPNLCFVFFLFLSLWCFALRFWIVAKSVFAATVFLFQLRFEQRSDSGVQRCCVPFSRCFWQQHHRFRNVFTFGVSFSSSCVFSSLFFFFFSFSFCFSVSFAKVRFSFVFECEVRSEGFALADSHEQHCWISHFFRPKTHWIHLGGHSVFQGCDHQKEFFFFVVVLMMFEHRFPAVVRIPTFAK
jgi:hypothetical protein